MIAMTVFIEKEDRHITIETPVSGTDLLEELGINPQTVLLVKNREIVLPEETLDPSDTIEILSVVSGG